MKTAANSTTPASEFTATYPVTGMTCEHCVASVTEEISELSSVTDVEVALSAGGTSIVTVRSSESLSDEDVAAAIDEAGYELVTS